MKDLATIRAEKCEAEKEAVIAALSDTGGNVSKAARLLNCSRYQLIRRIHKYDLFLARHGFARSSLAEAERILREASVLELTLWSDGLVQVTLRSGQHLTGQSLAEAIDADRGQT